MPYIRVGKCVYKKNSDGSKGEKKGCSGTVAGAKAYMRKLYQVENQKKSFAELSMAIVKASRDKETGTMHLSLVNSDTGEDKMGERMSLELFNDFVERIEQEVPVPAPFDKAICEENWCGGMPYLSISHYKSDIGTPGDVEKVYVDGSKLKSKVTLKNNPLGNAVWKSIYNDLYAEEKDYENPVRVSIGFLDLEHKHEVEGEEDFVFTRTALKQPCPKCVEGVKGKTYLKGVLVHKAFTRVPANPRTSVEVDEMETKSIVTKKDDATAIIGEELVNELQLKSDAAEEELITKAEKDLEQYAMGVRRAFSKEFAPPPRPSLWVRSVTEKHILVTETDYQDDAYSSKLYKVSYSENDGEFSFDKRSDWQEMEFALVPKKSEAEESDEWEFEFEEDEVVEEAMGKRKDVSAADKKRAAKKYGNVTYADPKNKKYPIDTAEHIRAAWNYIHQGKNAAKYSSSEVAAIKKRIVAAWKAKIDKKGPPSASKSKSEAVMENENLENLEVEEEVVEDTPAASEPQKSAVQLATEKFLQAYAQVEKSGLHGEDAVKALQPIMNELAQTTEAAINPAEPLTKDNMVEALTTAMKSVLPEMVAQMVKAAPAAQENKSAIPTSRSIFLNQQAPETEEKSQISKIAAQVAASTPYQG